MSDSSDRYFCDYVTASEKEEPSVDDECPTEDEHTVDKLLPVITRTSATPTSTPLSNHTPTETKRTTMANGHHTRQATFICGDEELTASSYKDVSLDASLNVYDRRIYSNELSHIDGKSSFFDSKITRNEVLLLVYYNLRVK